MALHNLCKKLHVSHSFLPGIEYFGNATCQITSILWFWGNKPQQVKNYFMK
jgi:hypothetical protein